VRRSSRRWASEQRDNKAEEGGLRIMKGLVGSSGWLRACTAPGCQIGLGRTRLGGSALNFVYSPDAVSLRQELASTLEWFLALGIVEGEQWLGGLK
jgi:hypothetical protein